MNTKENSIITYHYRGLVERPGKSNGQPVASYVMCKGFSEDGAGGCPQFPWMTSEECRKDALSRNAKAQFKR